MPYLTRHAQWALFYLIKHWVPHAVEVALQLAEQLDDRLFAFLDASGMKFEGQAIMEKARDAAADDAGQANGHGGLPVVEHDDEPARRPDLADNGDSPSGNGGQDDSDGQEDSDGHEDMPDSHGASTGGVATLAGDHDGVAVGYMDSLGEQVETFSGGRDSQSDHAEAVAGEAEPRRDGLLLGAAGRRAKRPAPHDSDDDSDFDGDGGADARAAGRPAKKAKTTAPAKKRRAGWTEEEDRALYEVIRARRDHETASGAPALQDVAMWRHCSEELARRGVDRSVFGCKNQWNRVTRNKYNLDDRARARNPSMTTSVQRSRKRAA